MDITEKIKNSFYPSVYSKSVDTKGSFKLCLIKNKLIARYALAVFDLAERIPVNEQIESARDAIFKSTSALWCVREVGVYIVFLAGSVPKAIQQEELAIDTTGFHAVMIQGVHIVGPNNYHLYNHSKWLNHTFGGANAISSQLQTI